MTTIVLENFLLFGPHPSGEMHLSSLETTEAPESLGRFADMYPSEDDQPAPDHHHHRPHARVTDHHRRPHERERGAPPRTHRHAPSYAGATPRAAPHHRAEEPFLTPNDYRLTDSPHHRRPFDKAATPHPRDDRHQAIPGDKRFGLGDRYKQAMRIAEDQLRKEGIPEGNLRPAAAIMVGNASAESELVPSTVHDKGTGYGIYGARLERRTAMLDWLASNGYAHDSLVGQMRYMAIEARRRGGPAWHALAGANKGNIGESGRIFEEGFEVPGRINNRNQQIREAYFAHGAPGELGTGTATPSTGGGGASPGRFGALTPAPGREAQIAGVDQRLMSAMAAGAAHLPPGYRVEPFSGYSPTHGAAGSRHRLGQAVDVNIIDPSGRRIPNEGPDTTGMYRRLAQHTYGEMLKSYPDLAPRFAHGAQFGTHGGGGIPDLMHYDIGGPRRSAGPQFSPTIQELGPIKSESASGGFHPIAGKVSDFANDGRFNSGVTGSGGAPHGTSSIPHQKEKRTGVPPMPLHPEMVDPAIIGPAIRFFFPAKNKK